MTRRRIRIEEQDNVVIVRGWGAGDLIKQAGIKPFWVGTQGGWMVDTDRLPDLLAYLDRRHIAVEGKQDPRRVGTCTSMPEDRQTDLPADGASFVDAPLWDPPTGGDAA